LLVILVALSSACRTAEITRLQRYEGDPVQQPRIIYIYDFRTDDTRVTLADESQDPASVAANVARALSLELIEELEDFKIPIERRTGPLDVPENSLAIHGEIVSIDEGSRARRVFIGFGNGASEVDTLGRLYLRGARGPEKMAEFRTTASSGNKPGILTTLPIGVAVQGLSLIVLGINAASATIGELNASVAGDARETASEWADALQDMFEIHGWLDDDPDLLDFD
jgi:hypothetical protein